MRFEDRAAAGRALARSLAHLGERDDVVVLGLPRGGVVVAAEVARALGASLDVLVVRKLGVPGHEELAMGAVATGDVLALNEDVVRELRLSPEVLRVVADRQKEELERRELLYRSDRLPLDLKGKVAVLVDDGLATGATMMAAIRAARALEPRLVCVAVPVAASETAAMVGAEADEVVVAHTPARMRAVGLWYEDFEQTTDEEVRATLAGFSEGGETRA